MKWNEFITIQFNTEAKIFCLMSPFFFVSEFNIEKDFFPLIYFMSIDLKMLSNFCLIKYGKRKSFVIKIETTSRQINA